MYLAKVAATIDVISGGRLEMGIGGGWYEDEWKAYGYGFPGAGERLGMLDEGVQIFQQAWSEGRATLDGRHYQVHDAICQPKPLQQNGIPLWIAGGGEKKTLRIAAQHAQYTNFDATPKTWAHKSAILEQHCRDVGRDFSEITRSGNVNVVIGRDEAEVADRLAWIEDHYRRLLPHRGGDLLDAYRNGPAVGTPEQVVERLRAAEGNGLAYTICYFADAAYDRGGIELFEQEVVPALA